MAETLNPALEEGWKNILADEFKKPYMFDVKRKLIEEKKKGYTVYPPGNLMFNAFNSTPFHSVRVVILGQDPYHGPGQAHGLCFSVPRGVAPPPSLVNIFKEIQADLGIPMPHHGELTAWTLQGVFLLNSILSVRASSAASHREFGWQGLTDAAIAALSRERENIVFLLWGRYAQEKAKLIDESKHLILRAPHPSPLSAHAGFFGCKHFSMTNRYLQDKGLSSIDWRL